MPSYQVDPSADAPRRLGRYELIGHLATGGMAEIHLARLAGEAGFEKIVVVKRLLPELVASPAYVAMFLDEGKLVARLDHPNICEVHELGKDGAEYYLAMPYLDGVPVHELIARPRDPDRLAQLRVAAGVIVQACEGLHHAHELHDADGAPAGLVHRDVSPSNLFVTAAGIVKVLDFGIAKVRGGTATEIGTVKGKSQYMAPEQLLGDPLDRRCDVFALGIVLFELATHQRLFKRPSEYLAARAILEEPTPRADAVDPAVPAALADVIAKALARDPAARYPDARALGEAVAATLPPASHAEIATAITSTNELTAQRTRQRRVLDDARSEQISPPALSRGGEDLPVGSQTTGRSDVRGAAGASGDSPIVDGRASTTSARTRSLRKSAPPDVDGVTVVTSLPTFARRSLVPWLVIGVGIAAVVTIAIAFFVHERGPEVRDDNLEAWKAAAEHYQPPPPPPARTDGHDEINDDEIDMPPDIARRAAKKPPEADKKPPGLFSIDSTPYATIYVDGAKLGVTPIVKRSLPAGRHKLRAVLEDGRVRELPIEIPSGRLAAPIQLTW